jgi:hypothetical protein
MISETSHELHQNIEFIDFLVMSRILLTVLEEILDATVLLNVGNIPVGVLTATIDFSKRFFVEQSYKTVSLESFLDDLSCQYILVNSVASLSKNTSNFELIGSNFIVSGLEWNTQFK